MIKFERINGGYYFWLFKGIVEMVMSAFIFLEGSSKSVSLKAVAYLILCLLLLGFGLSDLIYFFKLRELKK